MPKSVVLQIAKSPKVVQSSLNNDESLNSEKSPKSNHIAVYPQIVLLLLV